MLEDSKIYWHTMSRSALGLANIKITQETRDPASNIQGLMSQ